MKNKIFLICEIIFYLILPVSGACEDSIGKRASEVVGTIEEDKSTYYAVIKDENIGMNKLYMVGDLLYPHEDFLNSFSILDISSNIMLLKNKDGEVIVLTPGERIPIKGTNKVFVNTVEASILEYSYTEPSKELDKNAIEEFALQGFDNKKASLSKRYKRNGSSYRVLTPKEKSLFDSPIAEYVEQPNLKKELFLKIKIDKIGENKWEIDKNSISEATKNAEEVLFSIIKGVEPKFRFGEGPSLNFKSELGDATLNREGFIIRSLALARLGESFGIRQGDIVKSINGQTVNSLFGIYRVYKSILDSPNITEVNVDIIRDGRPKRFAYRIR